MKSMKMMLMLTLMCCATVSQATTVFVIGTVRSTLLADGSRYGACMANLSVSLAAAGLDCPGNWVTFSCSGDFQQKDVAWRMFDAAQMAHALGNRVKVRVTDTKKHNGYCYARRIDVLP